MAVAVTVGLAARAVAGEFDLLRGAPAESVIASALGAGSADRPAP